MRCRAYRGRGIYYFLERGTSLFPDALHIPHSTETLTYTSTHMLARMLAFYSASKTYNRKTHTHVFTSHMVVIVHHVLAVAQEGFLTCPRWLEQM
jgi:hypothetical protein